MTRFLFFLLVIFSISTYSKAPKIHTQNNCIENFQTSSLHYLWKIEHTRETLIRFFKNGIFQEDQNLAALVSKKLEELSARVNSTDDEILEKLRKFIFSKRKDYMSLVVQDDKGRILNRTGHVRKLISHPPSHYLDLGAGDGEIPSALAQEWEIGPENVYALDIVDYSKRNNRIKWIQYSSEKTIPLKDQSIELVSSFMVLHHVEDLEKTLSEVHRILRSKGKFMIRETDATERSVYVLNKFLDDMFYTVFQYTDEVPMPHNYRPKKVWIDIIEAKGFKLINEVNFETGNPFYPFYATFEKI